MKNIINKLKKLLLEFKGYYLNERMYQRLCYYIDDICYYIDDIEKQQEKVSKLLELYKEKDRLFDKRSQIQFEDISIFSSHALTLKIYDIKKQIKTLEEELK
jgi:hypothetical protein